MREKSCGTIPYTIKDGRLCYLLIRIRKNGVCGFPKGHVEMNESEEETALRETLEETSLRVRIDSGFRYETTYKMDNGNVKTVVYFLAAFSDQTPRRNGDFENFEYLLLGYEDALRRLTFENTREMLKAANAFLIDMLSKDSISAKQPF